MIVISLIYDFFCCQFSCPVHFTNLLQYVSHSKESILKIDGAEDPLLGFWTVRWRFHCVMSASGGLSRTGL